MNFKRLNIFFLIFLFLISFGSILEAKKPKPLPSSPLALEWRTFYGKYFDIPVSFDNVFVPQPSPDYFDIFIPATLDLNQAINACRKHFNVSVFCEGLGLKIVSNRREPLKGSYFVRFRKRVEADEEYGKFSANVLSARNIKGITLLERVVLELYYFSKTNKHLDIDSFTLCSGSRYPNGVPFVFWYGVCNKFSISWCSSNHALYGLRVREVIPYR